MKFEPWICKLCPYDFFLLFLITNITQSIEHSPPLGSVLLNVDQRSVSPVDPLESQIFCRFFAESLDVNTWYDLTKVNMLHKIKTMLLVTIKNRKSWRFEWSHPALNNIQNSCTQAIISAQLFTISELMLQLTKWWLCLRQEGVRAMYGSSNEDGRWQPFGQLKVKVIEGNNFSNWN